MQTRTAGFGGAIGLLVVCVAPVLLAQQTLSYKGAQLSVAKVGRARAFSAGPEFTFKPKGAGDELVIVHLKVTFADGNRPKASNQLLDPRALEFKASDVQLLDSGGKKFSFKGVDLVYSAVNEPGFRTSESRSDWASGKVISDPKQGVLFIDSAKGKLLVPPEFPDGAPLVFAVPSGAGVAVLAVGKLRFDLASFEAARGSQ